MSDNRAPAKLNKVDKAAILLLSLGETDAAQVLRHMGPKEVQRVGVAMSQMRNVQREQVEQYVTQLEKQLPSKAEMAALLSDINQAGLGRSLQFDVFRPGAMVTKEYYAELPIAIKVTGRYHDMGAFASDVAHLSRIVTLANLSVVPVKVGALAMEATARTFRYLDQEEIAAQKSTKKPGGAK